MYTTKSEQWHKNRFWPIELSKFHNQNCPATFQFSSWEYIILYNDFICALFTIENMFTCPFQKNINILGRMGWKLIYFYIYWRCTFKIYCSTFSSFGEKMWICMCVLTHLTPPPPRVLFITYVIGAMLEDWQKIGHTFESAPYWYFYLIFG
jgi:hypothetical protein